jgi:hypothetical protein
MKTQILAFTMLLVTLNCLHLSHNNEVTLNQVELTIIFAARDNVPLESCKFKIKWNGVVIAEIEPADYEIHTWTHKLTTVAGNNRVGLAGAGSSNGLGVGIHSVVLE